MEVQAAVGVEAQETAAWGDTIQGRAGPGEGAATGVGGWPVWWKLDIQCSRMTQKSRQSFRNVHFLVWNAGKRRE